MRKKREQAAEKTKYTLKDRVLLKSKGKRMSH
jgi:hypothetical protein